MSKDVQGKELQKLLKKKNVVCKGCSEKIDFVTRVFETQELPDYIPPPPPPPIVKEGEGLDKAKIDEVCCIAGIALKVRLN